MDIPVILDGELLTFEKAIKKKKYVDENIDQDILDKVNKKNDGEKDYYYYLEKEVYRLAVEEENMMTAIKFVNSKNNFDIEFLKESLTAIAYLNIISYGYRLSFVAKVEKKLNVENVYTGSVFNNSSYSSKTYNLLDKLFKQIGEDYIKRVKSSYDISDYIIHKVENRWLIINRANGATDILNDIESEMCEIANNVTECFEDDNILRNSKHTDVQIEKLHEEIIKYIEDKRNNM